MILSVIFVWLALLYAMISLMHIELDHAQRLLYLDRWSQESDADIAALWDKDIVDIADIAEFRHREHIRYTAYCMHRNAVYGF